MQAVAFHADGKHLVGLNNAREVVQWELASDQDRYALASRPLPTAATDDSVLWKFSGNKDRLAYIIGDKFLSVRSAAGQLLFQRDQNEEAQLRTLPALEFSPNGELLALVIETGIAPDTTIKVELLDLNTAKVRWTIPVRSSFIPGCQAAFAHDASVLYVTSGASLIRIDVESGKLIDAQPKPPSATQQLYTNGFQRSLDGRQIFAASYVPRTQNAGSMFTAVVEDVVTGERIGGLDGAQTSSVQMPAIISNSLKVSPRGDALVRASGRGVQELWSLVQQKLLARVPGDSAMFSHDGNLLVVASDFTGQRSRPTRVMGPTGARPVSQGKQFYVPSAGAKIYSTKNGQLISSLTFDGDPADEIRLSTDNRRLFTFHGKQLKDTDSSAAHVRIWDCATAQEILDLPISKESRCFWDLEASSTENSLIA